MKPQGFLLGLFSVGGQVLLLRELVSSLNGDELFIGTALFGWMIAVALGAYLGGKSIRPKNPKVLFVIGAILLPVVIIAVRWSPLMVTSVTGEVVPFAKAALISIVAMFPIGIISGWLFPLITRRILFPASDAVIIVYLYEGIGAFVAGIAVTLCTGTVMSTLSTASSLAVVMISLCCISRKLRRLLLVGGGCLIALGIITRFTPDLDMHLDALKYDTYEIVASFDTPHGHQSLLSHDGNFALMTGNTIEAVYPDRETAENHFVVPLCYNPVPTHPLFVGRPEFGVAQLAEGIIPTKLAAVDARPRLTGILEDALPSVSNTHWYYDDPVSFFSRKNPFTRYDIIMIDAGQPDNYLSGRYITPEFLASVKRWLTDNGILCLAMGFDTDRYISPEKKQVLGIIYNTLKGSFANVNVWPGTVTVFLSADRPRLDLSLEEIISRKNISRVPALYISEDYLYDRLGEMKVDRLRSALSVHNLVNTTEKPILTHYQALYRSTAHPIDRSILSSILGSTSWLIIIPIAILLLFVMTCRSQDRARSNGLFLYFVAGVVSLSLELISFYLYQTMAGSLYSEMSLLIGSFMLGLAVGTYYAHKVGDAPLEYPALIILLVSIIIFLTTWNKIGTDALLPFHTLFLFVVAVATGTLFVGATNIYYGDDRQTNRGAGYAWELAGSALGALLTLTILLPVIGLTWLLISLAGLIILALGGSIMSNKPMRAY